MQKPSQRMAYLWLTPAHIAAMIQQCRDEKPREACGLIAGRGGQAVEIIPVENVAATPKQHYEMDAVALSRELPRLSPESGDTDGLALIGVYHSHPSGDALPSAYDVRHAAYADVAYLIVGMKHEPPTLSAWQFVDGRAVPVALHISDLAPNEAWVTETADTPLSMAQRNAILLAGGLALIAVIILSLSLLPPAPVIP